MSPDATPLLSGYVPLSGAYDELFTSQGTPHPEVSRVVEHLGRLPQSDFKARQKLANGAFLHGGVTQRVRERIAGVAGRHLPQFADAAAAHLWCGMRTFADDHRFTIGWDADVGGLFWVAGLGGHGMSTAPAVAQLAADALLGAPLDSGLSAFEPGRHADSVEARS